MYEVEQKYRVASFDAVEAFLRTRGASLEEPLEQRDLYFAHPARDFARTDEALRLRQAGERNYLTYKGPKIDATTKTRQEIELPLPPDPEAGASWRSLLEALGFWPVREVVKRRRRGRMRFHELDVEVAMDEVEHLGRFVELEAPARPDQLDHARQVLSDLAEAMGLRGAVRDSYLELLLRGVSSSP